MYIKRLEKAGTTLAPNLPSAVEQLGSATVQNADLAEVKAELNKMSKQLKKLVDLKKQDNQMAAIFYLCAIALGVVYVLLIFLVKQDTATDQSTGGQTCGQICVQGVLKQC